MASALAASNPPTRVTVEPPPVSVAGKNGLGEFPAAIRPQPFEDKGHPVFGGWDPGVPLLDELEQQLELIRIVGHDGFLRFFLAVFLEEGVEFFGKRQSLDHVRGGAFFIDLDIFLIHVVEVAGAGFGKIVHQGEPEHAVGIDVGVVEAREDKGDHGDPERVIRDAFAFGSGQELPARPWGTFEHPDFEEEICDSIHGHLRGESVAGTDTDAGLAGNTPSRYSVVTSTSSGGPQHMAIDLDNLDPDTREAFERLRSVNMSMGAYLKIVEGALLAAWTAGEAPREALMAKDDAELTDEERKTRTAWELVREIVLRVPKER